MPGVGRSEHLVRFEGFELDARTGELRKDGVSIVRLSEQPLRIMIALLERPGELVLREDLRRRLWPNDTVVEFEHSINAAIKRLRQALGDSADHPRFIETLARRGYRWKTRAEWIQAGPERDPQSVTSRDQDLVGKRVSHYRVLEVLGGGGMGLVYKAEDLKLGRRVALKFLPEELAGDATALERFRREARAASVTDHPNICTVYEVGEYEGAPFIAMQLLLGQSLSERIDSCGQTPIGLEELLGLAIQIAGGLDAAHREGIIHRDIKPANIFVTNRGEAKILDFGLAKLTDAGDHGDGACASGEAQPLSLDLTNVGTAVGTASYMSPEQVRGEKLDPRTDLFSFGLVLFEMSTGRRAFAGGSASEVHDAVLHQTPPSVRLLNSQLPPGFETIVEKALAKDRESRYQTAGELRADLERARKETGLPDAATRQGVAVPSASLRALLCVAGLFAILLVVGGTWIGLRVPTVPAMKLTQLTWNSSEMPVRTGAISPDGKYLAYTDLEGIHIKNLATNETHTVPRPDSVHDSRVDWTVVSWFPDGTRFIAQIGPFGEGCMGCDALTTWVVSVLGGPPHQIHAERSAESLSPDGRLIASTSVLGAPGGREVWLMDAAGEQPRKIFETDQESWMRYVRWSPDGKRLAYVHVHETVGKDWALESRPIDGGPAVAILPSANGVHDYAWLPDGHIIYGMEEASGNGCNYWKVNIDLRTGRPDGQPRKVTQWAGFCLDTTSVTADGKRLAFTEPTQLGTIYVASLENAGTRITTPKRLSLIDASNELSGWMADNNSVIFSSNSDGVWGFYRQALDSNTALPILTGLREPWRGNPVSPDGRWVLHIESVVGESVAAPQKLMRVPVNGGPAALVVSGRLWGVRCARLPADLCVLKEWSADGKDLVFSAVDAVHGRGEELLRMSAREDSNWELSPDGLRLALFGVAGPIRILTLSDRRIHEITAKDAKGMDYLTWAGDSKGLYGSIPSRQGAILLHSDLQGNVHRIWQQRGGLWNAGLPSPDGRHLAIQAWSQSSNVWMMESF